MRKLKLAIVGASGLVGQTILDVLKEEQMLDVFSLSLFVSDKSAGKVMQFDGKQYILIELNERSCKEKFDIVIFSAGDEVSKNFAQKFIENGAYVVDNSNAFRRFDDVPLVVPEINAQKIFSGSKLISNPNCSTIQLVVVLDVLRKLSGIKKVVVSTYQSVSGAGKDALDDLYGETKLVMKEGIKDNVIAHIGDFAPNGNCVEEEKIIFETGKILEENFGVCAMTVRIPIPYCHSESVFVEFEEDVSVPDAEKLLLGAKHISYLSGGVCLPTECAGSNKTFVCRLKKVEKNELSLFIVADNLRRGAAYNAVMITKIIALKILGTIS